MLGDPAEGVPDPSTIRSWQHNANKTCGENPYYEVGLNHPLNGIFGSKKRRLLRKSDNDLTEFDNSSSVIYQSPVSSQAKRLR